MVGATTCFLPILNTATHTGRVGVVGGGVRCGSHATPHHDATSLRHAAYAADSAILRY